MTESTVQFGDQEDLTPFRTGGRKRKPALKQYVDALAATAADVAKYVSVADDGDRKVKMAELRRAATELGVGVVTRQGEDRIVFRQAPKRARKVAAVEVGAVEAAAPDEGAADEDSARDADTLTDSADVTAEKVSPRGRRGK